MNYPTVSSVDNTEQIVWQASLVVMINGQDAEQEELYPAEQYQLNNEMLSGRLGGTFAFHDDRFIDWSVTYDVYEDGDEVPFRILTNEEQEQIRWEIAFGGRMQGSLSDCKR